MKKTVIVTAAGVLSLIASASNSYALGNPVLGNVAALSESRLVEALVPAASSSRSAAPVQVSQVPGMMGVNPGSQGVYRDNRGVNPGSQGVNRGSQGVYRSNQGVNPGSQGVNRGSQGVTTPACRHGTYTLNGTVYCKP
jgi:hypothetical protein